MKMPEPMIVPTTIALVIQMPIVCGLRWFACHLRPPGLGKRRLMRLVARHAKPTGAMMRAFLFPGQGSQSVGMGAALAEASRAARDVFDEVDEALGQNLFRLMRDGPDEELRLTENAQPAIMAQFDGGVRRADQGRRRRARQGGAASSPATASANIRRCARPDRSTFATTAKLLKLRGQAMQAGGAGRCRARWRRCSARTSSLRSASPMPRRRAKSAPSPTTMIPSQVVISGHKGAIDRAIEMAKEMGAKRAVPLPVSAPFHCPLMQPAAEAMQDALSYVVVDTPAVPLFANVTRRRRRRPRHDPQPAGRAGHRHGPLARKRGQHGRGRRRGIRRDRRQGARADGQAHRCPTPR